MGKPRLIHAILWLLLHPVVGQVTPVRAAAWLPALMHLTNSHYRILLCFQFLATDQDTHEEPHQGK
jgi:hypothetical protein